ncbi:membrane protein [Asanoa ishikariensis]|uniref:ABC-2 family transporter protein n=1 Tax=Asanoa ishikariensis TaxID=137265 RepID=A0A1H3UH96_9ACTN|nr:hypothetical protein [Asanoa ishikariensis]GIF63542.1 membrane protein [Asanoa ishikariensis]SDZ61686.1 hypothetical protein SAMN05421684_7296 [Asanoa ishikariensis]
MALFAPGGPGPTEHSTARKMAVTVGGLLIVMVILLTAFALPGVNTAVKDVPVAATGTGPAAVRLKATLDRAAPGAFDVSLVGSAEASERKILDRDVYGAFIVDDDGLTLDTASAASSAVATSLTQVAQQLGAAMKLPVTVHDLRPLTTDDPKGLGLAAGALPIALGGWLAAMGIIALVVGAWQRLIAAAAFGVAGGFVLSGTLFAIGTFDTNYWATSAAAALGLAATCYFVLGFERLLRGGGIAIAALTLILLGNPLSGQASAPEMLPHPWGTLGQFLPPGATGTLLRNVSFFDGAAIARPIVVLVAWAVLGLVAYYLAGRRHKRRTPFDLHLDDADEPAPVGRHHRREIGESLPA